MEIEAWQDEIRVILDKRVDHTCEVQSIVLAVFPTPYSLAFGPRYTNKPRTKAPHPFDKCYKP
ncbi:MAG: hypothetical protein F6J90_33735 [Moorea sp. SIOASIH]|uniref:hypothetical protein n=1 Tax=Moorena sp. SIOASIH TaxID=2607817 RepID=UPI0013B6E10A|nr:hypothetical protein [Moorena sp. SIOASIH]NEO41028.1 hypothetical protein [Moorena sp. SIOASIH]